MATVEPKVKYLLLPIGVNGKSDGMSPVEAEGIVAGYLPRWYGRGARPCQVIFCFFWLGVLHSRFL
jgi:hypothetical protein